MDGRYEREMEDGIVGGIELKKNEPLRYECLEGEACVWND